VNGYTTFGGSTDLVSGVRPVETERLSADVRQGLEALRRLRGETERPVAAPARPDVPRVAAQSLPAPTKADADPDADGAKPVYRWTNGALTSAEAVMPGRLINVMA